MAKLAEEEKARRAQTRRRNEALKAEEDAVRWEEKRREWETSGTYLTRAELEAGVPCRGCGLPMIDRRESWPPLLKMDERQRKEYEAENADFRKRHPDCRSHRWIRGRTTHCGFCCPPPPMSESQIAKIAGLFSRLGPANPAELDTWRLELTCGHAIEKTQHRSNVYWTGSVGECPECAQIRGIVEKEKLPPNAARRKADQRRTLDELEKARTDHERMQKKADAARRRMARLEKEVAAWDDDL